MKDAKVVRIGSGAGFSGDRIDPAIELATQGALDYLIFECLAERTIAIAQQAKARDPRTGFDPMLAERMLAVLPACVERRIRIITNMGAANPSAAAGVIKEVARDLGIRGLSIATVTGDDVLDLVRQRNCVISETGKPIATIEDRLISANAYIGAEPIVEALASSFTPVGGRRHVTGRRIEPHVPKVAG